jgi:hypothetical protein
MSVYSAEVTDLVHEYMEAEEELRLRVMHRKETLRHKKLYERQIELLKAISKLCPDKSPTEVVNDLRREQT